MTKPDSGDYSLTVSTFIAASPEIVFRYLIDPERFQQWIQAPVELTPEVGGRLRIDFADHDTVVEGEVAEIVPGERVVLTWGVAEGRQADDMPAGSTRVTIALAPERDGTRVTLTHAALPSEKEREGHTGGWLHYLSQLSLQVTDEALGDDAGDVVDTFHAAWSETDPAERAALLERAVTADAEYADAYAKVDGRDALGRHIASVQAMLPGQRVERDGDVRLCHQYFTVDWAAKGAGADVLGRGTGFGELSADGRIRRLVGFWSG